MGMVGLRTIMTYWGKMGSINLVRQNSQILHITVMDKFIPSFMYFVERNFGLDNHIFVVLGKENYNYGLQKSFPIVWIDNKVKGINLLLRMYKAEKIILHGLWNERLLQILYFNPWLLKKCYWVMWGGDFYFPEKQSELKKKIIKKMRNFITYIDGDFEYVKENYGADGKLHHCFMYLSNIFKGDYIYRSKNENLPITILVGNSATETNHHFDIFNRLVKYKDENIKIYCPLSYGDKDYAKIVIENGKDLFGEKFIPLTDFMTYEKYIKLLLDIDIAIFYHNRQQAMGNTIQLLGMGKKVYLRKDTPQYRLFEKLGVRVYDFDTEFNLELIDGQTSLNNHKIVKEYFSEENLKKQLESIFS